jgi:hypothetical protein
MEFLNDPLEVFKPVEDIMCCDKNGNCDCINAVCNNCAC